MAHLGFARTVYKSGSQGKAQARIEYITGREMPAPGKAAQQMAYIAGSREDLVKEGTRNLPAWAADAHAYFAAAERYEGGGAQRQYNAFEEWKITLPHELTRAQNEALIDDLLDVIAGSSLPCTYAFHEPRTLSGSRPQPHIHLLLSARRNDAYERTAETHFKRYNREHPERGGTQKDPAFRQLGAVKAHRVMIADMLNLHLERNGQVARVHPDSLKARGIDRQPEPKMSPGESHTYREAGVQSGRVREVLALRAVRAMQPPREQNNARQYWEQRKAFLGITRAMPHEQKLASILLKRHGSVERVPERTRHPAPSTDLARHFQRLTRQLDHEDSGAHGSLRVRLHEDRERGLSW